MDVPAHQHVSYLRRRLELLGIYALRNRHLYGDPDATTADKEHSSEALASCHSTTREKPVKLCCMLVLPYLQASMRAF